MGNTITLKAIDGHEFDVYQAPAQGERKGGLILIQEIFGVTAHIRELCDHFAGLGYETMAPAIFDRYQKHFTTGYTPEDMQAAVKMAGASGIETPMLDIQATADELKTRGPVAITGFCYGGAMSWLAASRLTGLKAASGFYGGMIANALLGDTPKIPTILHYGALDPNIPQSDIDKVHAAHPDIPMNVYAEGGHGFCRKGSSSYNEASAKLGLQRTLDLFAANT